MTPQVNESDFEPGPGWSRNFLARHADVIALTLPTALDTAREKWQTVDNFAWWYLCLERFLVKYSFCKVTPEYLDETREEVAKKVYPSDRPRLVWKEGRQSWLLMWDEVGLTLDIDHITTLIHVLLLPPPLTLIHVPLLSTPDGTVV